MTIENGIRSVQALVTIISSYINVPWRSFHRPNILLKNFPWRWWGDVYGLDQLGACSYIWATRVTLTSLLCPSITGIALARRVLLTKMKECWWWVCEIMRDGNDLWRIMQWSYIYICMHVCIISSTSVVSADFFAFLTLSVPIGHHIW